MQALSARRLYPAAREFFTKNCASSHGVLANWFTAAHPSAAWAQFQALAPEAAKSAYPAILQELGGIDTVPSLHEKIALFVRQLIGTPSRRTFIRSGVLRLEKS